MSLHYPLFKPTVVLTKSDVGLGNVPNVDATLRSNHTGTQTASTISDLDAEVSNNSSVVANTAKVSASGSVTSHSDVTSAGSGAIITAAERTAISTNTSGIATNVAAIATKSDKALPVLVTGTSYTMTANDEGKLIILQNAASTTVTLIEFSAAGETLIINQEGDITPTLGTLPTGMTVSADDVNKFQFMGKGDLGFFYCVNATPGSQIVKFFT